MQNGRKKSVWHDERNLSLLVDFYEYTMSNGLFVSGNRDAVVVYDYFYRTPVFQNGFTVVAGVEQFVEYVENLTFSIVSRATACFFASARFSSA